MPGPSILGPMISIFDLPHAELERLLQRGTPVYLSVNPVEFHGPHLPLRTDALISAGLIRDMHRRLLDKHPDWPLLVASDLEIGTDPCPGPGSRHVPYGVVRDTVTEAARALAELGAKRVIFMTFHGSPLHNQALDHAVDFLRGLGVQGFAPLNLLLREMLGGSDLDQYREAFADIPDERERREMLEDLPHDFHAGFFETSLVLHYEPNAVLPEYRSIAPCPKVQANGFVAAIARGLRSIGFAALARDLELAAAGLGWYAIRPFPGYTGRPHRASSAAGAFFADVIADRYATVAEGVFAGAEPPRSILRWLKYASLGGRLGNVKIPIEAVGRTPGALEPRGASPEAGSGPGRMYGGAQDVRRQAGLSS